MVAWLGLALSAWLALFQVLLTCGAPLGYLAWGGQDAGVLPKGKRIASLFSARLMALFATGFGQIAGLWVLWPESLVYGLMVAGIPLFALSTLGNLTTSSRAERRLGVPVAFGLLCACAVMVFA